MDQHDLLRTEKMLGDRQGADLVIRDHAARVADYMRVPDRKPEDRIRIQTRVHTDNDRDLLGGRPGSGRSPLSKPSSKAPLFFRNSSMALISASLQTWFRQTC